MLDIEIPFPVRKVGTATVRGRVMFTDGTPAVGTTVAIASPSSARPGVMGIQLPMSLPSAYAVSEVPVRPDGTFEFSNLVPGFYNARASLRDKHVYESFEVGTDPVEVTFMLPLP